MFRLGKVNVIRLCKYLSWTPGRACSRTKLLRMTSAGHPSRNVPCWTGLQSVLLAETVTAVSHPGQASVPCGEEAELQGWLGTSAIPASQFVFPFLDDTRRGLWRACWKAALAYWKQIDMLGEQEGGGFCRPSVPSSPRPYLAHALTGSLEDTSRHI